MIAKKGFLKREQFTYDQFCSTSQNTGNIERQREQTIEHQQKELDEAMVGDLNGVATLRKNRALNANNYRNGINRQIAAVSMPLTPLEDEQYQPQVNSNPLEASLDS